MAGKRHHINPRFLLKGFTASSRKNFVWVFRHDSPPFISNIINVGVESNFYTHDNKVEADSAITKVEPIFASLLDKIRAGEAAALSSPHLPEMIAHFEMRTSHLRSYLLQANKLAISSISDFIGDNNNLPGKLKRMISSNPSQLRDAVRDSLEEQSLPREMLQPTLMLATRFGPDLIDQQQRFLHDFAASMQDLLGKYEERAPKTAQYGHIKSMQRSPATTARADRYKNLTYSIVKKLDGTILGDSLVLFRINSERRYKATLDADDEMIAVYLPIDSETVLVGANRFEKTIPDDFSEAVARCSLKYFVASQNTEAYQKLQGKIGSNTIFFTEEEKKRITGEILSEEQRNYQITVTPVFQYHTYTVSLEGEPEKSAILLVLLTKWGHQGFVLNKEAAKDLLQDLSSARKTHSETKRA